VYKRGRFDPYKDQFAPANRYPMDGLICIRIDKIAAGREVLVLYPCETDGFWYAQGLARGHGNSLRGSELLCIESPYAKWEFPGVNPYK
jgi:hypothetical protein